MNRDIIAPLIFAIGCFIFFWLNVPEYDKILDIREASADLNALLSERSSMRENVVTLLKQYEMRKNEIDKLNLLIPANVKLDQIIESIQSMASTNGVQIREINVGKDVSQSNVGKANIKLSFSSNYSSLLNFLKDLEKNLRISDVSEIIISRDVIAESGVFQIQLSFSNYYLK